MRHKRKRSFHVSAFTMDGVTYVFDPGADFKVVIIFEQVTREGIQRNEIVIHLGHGAYIEKKEHD